MYCSLRLRYSATSQALAAIPAAWSPRARSHSRSSPRSCDVGQPPSPAARCATWTAALTTSSLTRPSRQVGSPRPRNQPRSGWCAVTPVTDMSSIRAGPLSPARIRDHSSAWAAATVPARDSEKAVAPEPKASATWPRWAVRRWSTWLMRSSSSPRPATRTGSWSRSVAPVRSRSPARTPGSLRHSCTALRYGSVAPRPLRVATSSRSMSARPYWTSALRYLYSGVPS